MPLNNYTPESDDNRSKVVSEENGRRHTGVNTGKCRVIQYKVDGKILIQQKACDYIVMNEDKNTAYLIELKGNKTNEAAEQLLATYQSLKHYLRGYKIHFRIISSKAKTHNINSAAFRKNKGELMKLGDFDMQNNKLSEDI